MEFLGIKARSGLRESPVIKLGDKMEGRSAHNEQFENEEKLQLLVPRHSL